MTSSDDSLDREAMRALEEARTADDLEKARIGFLGRKGALSLRMRALGGLHPAMRRAEGVALNALKDRFTALFMEKRAALGQKALEDKLGGETPDLSLPGRRPPLGRLHPLYRTMEEFLTILGALGFVVKDGPHIEEDWYNFTALNIPAHHPARQQHDTFYLKARRPDGGRFVLRTHTSPVQIRAMKAGKPPFRIVAPGATYRSDSDATHTPMFHQLEVLYVDKGVHMGHLKGFLEEFFRLFFGKAVPLRLRASYFPFTEPSLEVDVQVKRTPSRLIVGQGSDWLEVLGCGMVHPKVLENVGVDPTLYTGFAAGLGIERFTMIRDGQADVRDFFDGRRSWMDHYGRSAFESGVLSAEDDRKAAG